MTLHVITENFGKGEHTTNYREKEWVEKVKSCQNVFVRTAGVTVDSASTKKKKR